MTYNIKVGVIGGHPPVIEAIRSVQPDVIALQEVGRHYSLGPPGDTTSVIAAACELPHTIFVRTIASDDSDAGFGHALLSRWPLISADVLDLPQRSDEPRRVLVATVNAAGRESVVIATHLSHLEHERDDQWPALLDAVNEHSRGDRPVVLMGDLNTHDDGPWVRTLGEQFADADGANRKPTFPAAAPTDRIDYLLASSGRWTETRVVGGADASDHLAVVGALELA
jgi:endonuclease/exonuclease/phosphatase family metal-dependent hydrolase